MTEMTRKAKCSMICQHREPNIVSSMDRKLRMFLKSGFLGHTQN